MGTGQDASYGYAELNVALPLHYGQNVTERSQFQSIWKYIQLHTHGFDAVTG